MVSKLGQTFQSMDDSLSNLRLFAYRHKTPFELLFLLLYTTIQTALIVLSYKPIIDIKLTAALVAIAMMFTFTAHKLLMESRFAVQSKQLQEVRASYQTLRMEADDLRNAIFEIDESWELHKEATPKNKKV